MKEDVQIEVVSEEPEYVCVDEKKRPDGATHLSDEKPADEEIEAADEGSPGRDQDNPDKEGK